MKLNTSFGNFKRLHISKQNQTVVCSQNCKNYTFVENLYKFILVKKQRMQLLDIISVINHILKIEFMKNT